MSEPYNINEGMPVVGADGVPVGTVAAFANGRIKLRPSGQGSHSDHSHYVPAGLIAFVKDGSIYLSANGANAALLDEEQDGSSAD